jgi:predicted ATPase
MISFYDQREHASLAFVYGHDYGVASRAWDAWAQWFLGYPEKAKQVCLDAISLAETVEHPFSLTLACSLAATVFAYRREPEEARKLGERVKNLVQEHGFVFYNGSANFALGWSSAASGQVEKGVAQMREGLAVWEALGARVYRRAILIFIADLHLLSGNLRRASSTIEEIETMANRDAERYYDAELQRVKGELILAQDHDARKAEACIQQALQIARRQKAKALELRAVTSLARLWNSQGRQAEAYEVLSTTYSWFTEGFDTHDLKNARMLLSELSFPA